MAKLIFFGTPDYVLPVLEALSKKHTISAVVTQPPKPFGRKQILTPPSVSLWARKQKIRVFDETPKKILSNLKTIDAQAGVLASFGRILPKELLELFPSGILNIHPSLLPQWRGASPIEAQVITGTHESGVTFIKLDEEMDHGPIVGQWQIHNFHGFLSKEEARTSMFAWAAKKVNAVVDVFIKDPQLQEQNHKEATYTTLLNKDHGFISSAFLYQAMGGDLQKKDSWKIDFIQDRNRKPYLFTPSTYLIKRFVDVMNPWPGAWTHITVDSVQKRLKILKVALEEQTVQHNRQGWQINENKKLVIQEVQLEGKNPVSWKQFK